MSHRPSLPESREDARSRLIVALDVPHAEEAESLVESLGDSVGFYKVGLQLWTRGGPELVRRLAERGLDVFVDLKLHDIPKTVELATANVVPLGGRFLTIHEPPSTVRGAVAGRADSGLALLGITYLTSMSEEEIRLVYGLSDETAISDAIVEKGKRLVEAGCDGLVCSPHEVARLREALPDAILVTPGIRPAGADAGDQARVATAHDAAEAGADYVVVGRPVRDAPDRHAAVEALIDELWTAWSDE
jgi:orotidine-5'-phosphate decarboxylase